MHCDLCVTFFIQTTGTTPIDQLKPGMRLELQDYLNPLEVWMVKIIENIGGRLYLRLEGVESGSKDFWMFYLHFRLHPVGWSKVEEGCFYKPPSSKFELNYMMLKFLSQKFSDIHRKSEKSSHSVEG